MKEWSLSALGSNHRSKPTSQSTGLQPGIRTEPVLPQRNLPRRLHERLVGVLGRLQYCQSEAASPLGTPAHEPGLSVERKAYAIRRRHGSLCTHKQPEAGLSVLRAHCNASLWTD